MNPVMRCGIIFFFVLLMLLAPQRLLHAMDSAPVLRVGCLDVSSFPDGSPERLLFNYAKRYLNEVARSTGWQYEYVEMDEWTAREMLREGRIDMYFPAREMPGDEGAFSFSVDSAAYSILSLYVREDSSLETNNPAVLANMRIGVLQDGLYSYALTPLVREQGVRVDVVEHQTAEALHEALARGEVDAILDSASRQKDGEKLFLRVALMPAKFIAAKKREGLLKNLSDTILYTERVNPSFETYLGKAFLDRAQNQLVRFNASENAYLASAPDLRVVYVGGHEPFFGDRLEKGVPEGIYPSLLKALGETLGLRFRFVRATNMR